jgi:hypothetical protein
MTDMILAMTSMTGATGVEHTVAGPEADRHILQSETVAGMAAIKRHPEEVLCPESPHRAIVIGAQRRVIVNITKFALSLAQPMLTMSGIGGMQTGTTFSFPILRVYG